MMHPASGTVKEEYVFARNTHKISTKTWFALPLFKNADATHC